MIPFLDFLTPLIEKALNFIPDPKMKAEAQQAIVNEMDKHSEELLKSLSASDNAQLAVNAEEAKSTNLFVSGPRPFIMWVCGIAFGWAFIGQPVVTYILKVTGHNIDNLPQVNMSEIMPVLLGILGLGGMRTWEKSQGCEDRHG